MSSNRTLNQRFVFRRGIMFPLYPILASDAIMRASRDRLGRSVRGGRRGLRGREAIMFVGYLVDASMGILETPQG